MAKEFFEPVKLTEESLALVGQMTTIMDNYHSQGYDLSLRQLYYQLVTQNIIANDERNYKRIGSILNDARLVGLVDWDMIVDRGRSTEENSHWSSPKDILKACADSFRYRLWDNQPWHVEVMVEKQALEGVLLPVCSELDIPFSANKGYSSASAMRQTGKRLGKALEKGKHVCVIYLGDHDPSGLDMTRDVKERLEVFSDYFFWQPKGNAEDEYFKEAMQTMNCRRFKRWKNKKFSGQEFVIDRVALNKDQIDEYEPPPNPAKMTDSRAEAYVAEHGDESWELDALEPSVLADIVREAVAERRDEELWERAVERQDAAKEKLSDLARDWRD